MKSLIKTSLNRPIAVVVIIAGLIIFGIGSVAGMSLQLIPDMEMPMVMIQTVYPMAGPEDVERLVSKKIEDGCGSLSGLDTTYSYSRENVSIVLLQFEYGTDIDDAYMDVREALDVVKPNLPEEANDPVVATMDFNAAAVMQLSVNSETEDVSAFVEETLTPELDKISTITQVEVSGGQEDYISIELIPENLKQYSVSVNTVATTVGSANFTYPAGAAKHGGQDVDISSQVEYKTPEELRQIPITTASGQTIHLSDIANVRYASKRASSYSRFKGSDNLSVSISKQQSASAVTVSGQVTRLIKRLTDRYPDMDISVVYDSADIIRSSLRTIAETLLLGIVITMFVLFVFFGDIKGSLIVGSSMPVSLLLTFLLMSFMGFSLNMITMGALVIAIGMMVDNSIVVLEMCFRKKDDGLDYKDAAFEGTKIVLNSIIASTITTIVVYLPLAMMKDLSGQLFGQLGYTIVFALAASLISAITLVPLCFSFYKPVEKKESAVNRFLEKFATGYSKVLGRFLNHKALTAILALVIFVISVVLIKFINTQLFPNTDEGQIAITATFRPGTNIDTVDKKVRQIEDFVRNSDYIDDYSASARITSGTVNAYVAEGTEKSTAQIVDQFTQDLAGYADNCEISVEASSSLGITSLGGGNTYEVSFEGTDLDDLEDTLLEVDSIVMNVDGVISSSSSMGNTASRVKVDIDPINAAANGLTPVMIGASLNTALNGSDAMKVTIDDKTYQITVEYPEDEYETVNDVENMFITNPMGNEVPLRDVASLVYTDSPQQITRQNGRYYASVTATVRSDEKAAVTKAIEEALVDYVPPRTVEKTENQTTEMMNDEFASILKAIATAVILVYMVMAIEFGNLRYSGMVMFCIPFSLIGSILLLLVTRGLLSMVSLMGFLMLIGIVVNNGIIYVDYTNMLRSEGMATADALIETGRSRLRPILMTTLTTILSMVPMALGLGRNGELMQGMALVICGGLLASTVLTLLLLPTFYMIIHKHNKERRRKKEKVK
ncbi:MAG: efflux RND transporter permease subunit [Lachnospiraceae bacterium]|nr:efflux RND transporter permease subunit [Lachnospiraceae bacterium]